METAAEVPVLIKTAAKAVPTGRGGNSSGLHHPYELPEVMAVPVTAGLGCLSGVGSAETAPNPASALVIEQTCHTS